MVQLRGMLYKKAVKYERPKSLFGNMTYLQEQSNMRKAIDAVASGMFFYSPYGLGVRSPFPIERLSEDFRRKKIKANFKVAKNKLKEILG